MAICAFDSPQAEVATAPSLDNGIIPNAAFASLDVTPQNTGHSFQLTPTKGLDPESLLREQSADFLQASRYRISSMFRLAWRIARNFATPPCTTKTATETHCNKTHCDTTAMPLRLKGNRSLFMPGALAHAI